MGHDIVQESGLNSDYRKLTLIIFLFWKLIKCFGLIIFKDYENKNKKGDNVSERKLIYRK